jgi:chemotaxis protein CheD
MGTILLGIGDFGASNAKGDIVKTLALGSCVSVIFLDPVTKMVGMVHIALPDSSIVKEEDVKRLPGRFADTGIPALINKMKSLGMKDHKKLIVKLAGGSVIMDPKNTFNIGKRNVLAIKKILWEMGLGARKEDIGGTISRTVSVYVDTGRVVISSPGRDDWCI